MQESKFDDKLSFIRDSHESLFTILIYDTPKETFIADIKSKLEKIKDIKNTFKKNKLNNRLFKLLSNIEESTDLIINNVILVSDDIKYFKLNKNDIQMLKEYDIKKYTFEYNEYFNIHWLKDLFENFNFHNIIIYNSNQFTHYKGNNYKKKIIATNNSVDYINNINSPFIIVGKVNLNSLKIKSKFLLDHITSYTHWNDIINHLNDLEMSNKIILLDEHFTKLVNNSDIYVFGEEIYEFIEFYNVKELFIHKNTKNEFDTKIIQKNLIDNLNFNITFIDNINITKNLNLNNSVNTFLKDYGGIIAIKYY